MKPMNLQEAVRYFGPGILNNLKLVKAYAPGTGVLVTPPAIGQDGLYTISPDAEAGNVTPIGGLNQPAAYTSANYQTIHSYTVPANKVGFISEISFNSNNRTVQQWQVTIGGTVLITNEKTSTAVTIDYSKLNDGRGYKLKAGQFVKIEGKSDGATSITAEALITGTQEG